MSRNGKRARQRRQSNFLLFPPDARATGQGARFLPTDHRDTRRDPSHAPPGWKFCTMNMTAFFYSAPCHLRTWVSCLRIAGAGHAWAREVMREQNWSICFVGSSAIGLGSARPSADLQNVPLVSAQEKSLHDTGRYVRALVAYGNSDQVVRVVSLYGLAGATDIPEKMLKMSCR